MLPSEKAAEKLRQAKARVEKAQHREKLEQAKVLKWAQRVKRLEKKIATDHYKEMDAKAKEARVADAMKVAMGVKKAMLVGKAIDTTGRVAKPILRSSVCINGYHGLCGGRRLDKDGSGAVNVRDHGPCHCQCGHNTKQKGATG